jgi:two-component system sensor histidine kinase YesM
MRETQIVVTFANTAKTLVVTVSDNGNGIDEESRARFDRQLQTESQGTHRGLTNINQRIKLLYGQKYGLSLPLVETWFAVRMVLPLLGNAQDLD